MISLTIGNTTIAILPLGTESPRMTDAEQITYEVLKALAYISHDTAHRFQVDAVCRWLGLKSPLPLQHRLKTLEAKGFCKVLQQTV